MIQLLFFLLGKHLKHLSAGVEPDCSFLLRVCGGTGLLSMELFRTENGAGSSAHRLPKTARGSLTLQGRFVALALHGTQLKTVSESCFNFYFHLFSLFFSHAHPLQRHPGAVRCSSTRLGPTGSSSWLPGTACAVTCSHLQLLGFVAEAKKSAGKTFLGKWYEVLQSQPPVFLACTHCHSSGRYPCPCQGGWS